MSRLLCVLLLICGAGAARAGCAPDRVDLRGPWGEAQLQVELATTPESRSKGLMFRESLPRGAGMLFVYETPQRASFWMKNTLIPLDMLFVDRSGTVTRVHHDAVPGDLSAIIGGDAVYAVLEINGGLARRYGIVAGTQMRHQVFDDANPVWPC